MSSDALVATLRFVTEPELWLNFAISIGAAVAYLLFAQAYRNLISRGKTKEPSFSHRIAHLTENLSRSSRDVDDVLREIATVAAERQSAAAELEKELTRLAQRERELEKRIEDLNGIPIPVAEHFAKLMESGEKRSAKRDYFLCSAGVITSIISAIVLKAVGLV